MPRRLPRTLAVLFSLAVAALLVAGPWCYWSYRASLYRNLHVVREGVLYRSGQMPLRGLQRVILEQGIRTVVTLRDSRKHPDQPPPDSAEEAYCRDHFIRYYRLPPVAWWGKDGVVPATESVRKFLEVMHDPANYPVLVHCMAGIHRTGAFCAVYRMEIEHWTNEEAIAEMKQLGYDLIEEHEDLRSFLMHYEPAWHQAQVKRAGHEEAEPRPASAAEQGQ